MLIELEVVQLLELKRLLFELAFTPVPLVIMALFKLPSLKLELALTSLPYKPAKSKVRI